MSVVKKEKKKDEKWHSIKVREETYEELKRMGEGIGKAVDILVKEQKQKFERKLEDIEASAGDIANILLEAGIFDIKFKGAGVSDIEENGTLIRVRGYVNIDIPNDDARSQILSVLKGEEEIGVESESDSE